MTIKVDTATLQAEAALLRRPRHKTREVQVGSLLVGGDNPIWVQSMTVPDTHEVEKVVRQIHALEEAGCEIVRVTVPKAEDAGALSEIRKQIRIPLICDIHFDYKMALMAMDHPIDKIRMNPGNIGGYDRYRQVIRKAKDKGLPMRIGVNAGSLERELVEKHGYPCPAAMVESALRYIEIAESEKYHNIIVSLKSSDVITAAEAYRLYAKFCDYPTHIGITEAGKPPYAVTKSACGLAPILLDGIGDTIRISLLGDPVPEIAAAFDILQATQRRVRKPELIACPTCGRLEIDLEGIIAELEKRLDGRKVPIKVSVLGCIVNGPGEAREADLGIAAGKGKGVIFKRGEIIRNVLESEMVDALLEEIDKWEKEERDGGTLRRGTGGVSEGAVETPRRSLNEGNLVMTPVRRFTVAEYHKMIETGILTENDSLELIEGWLRYKIPRDSRHDGRLGLMHHSLEKLLIPGWHPRIQCAVALADSQPEPDIAIVSGVEEDYIDHHPGPPEIGLIVEVSNTSLAFDRTDKARLYANAGIPSYWIVNLDAAIVESYSDPTGPDPTPTYRNRQDFRPGEQIPFLLKGQSVGTVAVDDLRL